MEEQVDEKLLAKKCQDVRKLIIDSVFHAGSGHPGGSLSAVELTVTLYEMYLKHDSKNPKWAERDYFVLSKGHAAPLIYSVLAKQGYFDENELKTTLRKIGSRFQGHPDALKLPGIEVSTGSLGQGFGVAAGIALGLKHDKKPNRVYCLLGDGELQEGTVWETAMAAPHFGLDNFCAIVDSNKFQIDGEVAQIMNVESIKAKFEAFGWDAIEIDGHDLQQVAQAYNKFQSNASFLDNGKPRPTVIVANTTKGKGVSFMENTEKWHGKAPKENEYSDAQKEISGGK